MVRGIRGATTSENTVEAICRDTKELLARMLEANEVKTEDLASVVFTMTGDLNAVYPARAAREMGLTQVPLLCYQELAVAGSLDFCIRVLMTWNTEKTNREIKHVYLKRAVTLRPDLAQEKEAFSREK